MNILSHGSRSNRILGALQDKRARVQLRKVSTIVRKERDTGKVLGENRIGFAEAGFQFRRQFGPVGVSHDDWRHHRRPSRVIVI